MYMFTVRSASKSLKSLLFIAFDGCKMGFIFVYFRRLCPLFPLSLSLYLPSSCPFCLHSILFFRSLG